MTISTEMPDFDVAIIGGGPAGSSAAAYLAKAGVKCVVFERELFPRPHVGESLVPASTRVLREIGFDHKMEEAKFPRKFGAAWTTTAKPKYDMNWRGVDDDCKVDIRFAERTQPGVDRDYTWHVDRGKFDLMLLQHAHELGADVCEGVRVTRVDFDSKPYPRVYAMLGQKQFHVTCRCVLDASGRHTVLGRQLGLKISDEVFDQLAIHTWFEGYPREKGDGRSRHTPGTPNDKGDFIYIHFLPVSNTWVWQIPITETVTSFGVVTQKKNFAKTREQREQFFWECIATRPELHAGLKSATQVTPWRDEGDYSYGMSQICGDRFALIGDAQRFVDPIFSTGVSIALNGARLCTRDVIASLNNGAKFQREDFREFETLMRRGTNNWYKFISMYYRLNVLFTFFIGDPRFRLAVLKLLQGDVYDEDEPEVIGIMRETIKEVESNPKHMWHGLLGSLDATGVKPLY